MSNRIALWIGLPLSLLVLAGGVVLALPGLVSSPKNRAAIEALASSLTGEPVHIGGELSLALTPAPQLVAGNITIGGGVAGTITAKSLTLEIALSPLLHGQISARSLTLKSPVIALPWPSAGNGVNLMPPPWLSALHAQINNGQITLGSVVLSNVNADIFISNGGAFSFSGSGEYAGQHADVTASLGAIDTTAIAPLTIEIKNQSADLHISGTASTANTLNGTFTLQVAPNTLLQAGPAQSLVITGTLQANPGTMLLSGVQVRQGNAAITGTTRLDIAAHKIFMQLQGQQLNLAASTMQSGLPAPLQALAPALRNFTIHAELSTSNSSFAGIALPHAALTADFANGAVTVPSATVALPGNGSLAISGGLNSNGTLHGNIQLATADFASTLDKFGVHTTLPAALAANLATPLSGIADDLRFPEINGSIGPTNVTGSATWQNTHGHAVINSAWHFNELDLAALTSALQGLTPAGNITGNIEITADHADFNKFMFSHMLIDAGFADQLIVRQFSASAYNGMVAGSFTIAPGGQISSARAVMSIPSAQALAGFMPPAWAPPAAVLGQPLAASIIASGPATALATSATLTLGEFSVTASPVVDLLHLTAQGAFTLRHPSAMAAFSALGLNSTMQWPGPGSIALRANMQLEPATFGLPDFVLSLGSLTATGNIMLTTSGNVSGQINADTLALPALPPALPGFALNAMPASGKIGLNTNSVIYNGQEVLGPAQGNLQFQPHDAVLAITHASAAGGVLSGTASITTAPATPPSLNVDLALKAVDLSLVHLPVAFPVFLPTGSLDAKISVSTSGFDKATWAATMNGTASLQAHNGVLSGFNLGGVRNALALTNRYAALYGAATSGVTRFDNLSINGNFDHGIFKFANAALNATSGSASATGSVDIPDQQMAVNVNLQPIGAPGAGVSTGFIGGWQNLRKIPNLQAALRWQAAP